MAQGVRRRDVCGLVDLSGVRPAVSVVVPFGGAEADVEGTVARLRGLRLREHDELIVADNSLGGCFPVQAEGISVIRAGRERASYYARNAGAERASNEWLLFLDADCTPASSLLDDYFEPVPAPGCGLVAGAVVPAPAQQGLAPRYARSRGHLREDWHARGQPGWPHPSGVTGNLLVRSAAWRELGGFHEGIVSGGDVELSWRLQDAGWEFEWRPEARVEHAHVQTLARMASQTRRHAAGRRWVNRRYPGAFPRPRLAAPLARCGAGALAWAMRGEGERALFKLIDARWHWAGFCGYLWGDNRPARSGPGPGTAAFAARFPAAGACSPGEGMRVEALSRPARVDRALARATRIDYAEDDPPHKRLLAFALLAFTHPVRVRRALAARGADGSPLHVLAPVARRIRDARFRVLGDERGGDLAALVALVGPPGRDGGAAEQWGSENERPVP